VAFQTGRTNDEEDHIRYGAAILRGVADRSSFSYDSKMPVSALNALPGALALRNAGAARCATVLAAFGLCLLVYFYAKSLYGTAAGLAAQLLFVLAPNIGAHSALATTDLYAACGFVLTLYYLRRFLLLPTSRRAAMAAAMLALAQLTKFAALCLYPAIVLALGTVALAERLGWQDRYRLSARAILQFAAFHLVFFLIFVNAAFLLDRPFTPLAKHDFRTPGFQALQRIPVLRAIPLPVPYPYVQGFDMMSYANDNGDGNIMLLGELRGKKQAVSSGFHTYYLVCYALKEPLGMQLLFLLAIAWIVRYRRFEDVLAGELPLLASAGLLILWLSLFSRTQMGIRHILPALVMFVILSGAAFAGWHQFRLPRKILLVGCLLYVAISVGSYYPHLIPYFNEIVHDRKMAYRYLADSNLDWGQDSPLIDAFLQENPDVRLNPGAPVAGRILVSANFAAGIGPEGANYWVRRLGVLPVAHVGYGHLLFLVPAGVALPSEPARVARSASTTATPRQGAAPAGTSQAFTFTVTDTQGTNNLTILDVLINNTLEPRHACYLAYLPANKRLVLVNDAGDAGGPFAGSTTPNGATGNIQNSQCIITSATVNTTPNALSITLDIQFKKSFAGSRVVYASAQDNTEKSTGWQAVASWTVQ
jgi:hypothetical protein